MIDQTNILSIGYVSRTHGTKGELQILMSRTPELLDLWDMIDPTFIVLNLDSLPVPFRLTDWRTKGADSLIIALKGVDDESAAQRLVGATVSIFRQDCRKWINGGSTDSYDIDDEPLLIWQDLVGYKAYTAQGKALGEIVKVDDNTANIFAETTEGILFPLHEDLITSLDTNKKAIVLVDTIALL
ncbi:MAG: hypothetical protein IJS00_00540 [Paludibacteraceae bacterium]|nr:hypothetical protein [Paludibacteraceae bacterium]